MSVTSAYHICLDLLSAAWLGYKYFSFDVGVLEELQESTVNVRTECLGWI